MEPTKGKGDSPYALELAAVKDHIELVFHRYLEGTVPGREKVTIRLNGEPLRPNNPMGHPLTKVFEERRIEIPGRDPEPAATLSVRAFVTPNEAEFEEYIRPLPPVERLVEKNRMTLNGRANDAQGFYFYRLHRLIKWGGWEDIFAKDEHTKLLRVVVDFDRRADEQLQVDISKQLIRLPFAVSEHLKNILKGPRAEARSRYDKKVRPSDKPLAGGGQKHAPVTPSPLRPTVPVGGTAVVSSSTPSDVPPTGTMSPAPLKKDKSALRLVSAGSVPWERKIGFGGEQVEVTPLVPELVALVQTIEKDNEAKAALSEFLRVLEVAGVPKLLTDNP
jgi:hypothetical protein